MVGAQDSVGRDVGESVNAEFLSVRYARGDDSG
jgi:hypothetical protein